MKRKTCTLCTESDSYNLGRLVLFPHRMGSPDSVPLADYNTEPYWTVPGKMGHQQIGE